MALSLKNGKDLENNDHKNLSSLERKDLKNIHIQVSYQITNTLNKAKTNNVALIKIIVFKINRLL